MTPRRVIALSAVCAAVLLLVAGGIAWTAVQRFLSSEAFRRLVAAKTGQALRVDATYSPFSWQGASVYSDTLTGTGLADGVTRELRADQIRARINWRSAFEGAWKVDDLEVGALDATFGPRVNDTLDASAAPAPPDRAPGWLPKRFEMGTATIGRARIQFVRADERRAALLNDAALTLKPEGDEWVIDGHGGTLALGVLPLMDLESFRARLRTGTLFLSDAKLRIGETGRIAASGEFSQSSHIRAEWQGVDVAPFLPVNWKPRISGSLSGTGTADWTSGGLGSFQSDGAFLLTDGTLHDLPVLAEIAKFTGTPRFNRMTLQEVSGSYSWRDGRLAISNAVLESKGLLRLEGSCAVEANGAVSGDFHVGVTAQSLQWLPGSRERVFTEARDGYLWTSLRVSGSLDQLNEDLSSRLVRAAGEQAIDEGRRTLDKLPAPAREGAKRVLDALLPLIP